MFVYIMGTKRRGVLYTGVTSDIIKRVYEHKTKIIGGFTARYGLDRPIYFEEIDDPLTAIARKFELIEGLNPEWADLYPSLLG